MRSDLDLFIIQDTTLPFARRAEAVAPLLASAPVRINIHVYTPAEVESYRQDPFSLVASVLTSGRTVYEQGGS